MEQTKVQLSDGRTVVVRAPAVPDDVKSLAAFFTRLPPKVRNYLKFNSTDQEVLQERLERLDDKNHWRLIAELEGHIVADAIMDREPYGWTRHVARLHAVGRPEHAGLGIKRLLFRQLVETGGGAGIERFDVEVIGSQTSLVQALIRDGFTFEATRRNFARDKNGRLHDMVILSSDHGSIWASLEKQIEDLDIRWARRYGG
jgi:hypothetical protein